MQETRVFEEKKYTHLYMAILELPEELRILVTLYYIEGFSQKEIVEILGMQEGTIKSRLSRARRLLREILTEADASRSKETKGGTRLQLR